MKIAYLVKKFPRLSETFVLGEVLRQEQRGTDVVVFARRDADDEPRHQAFSDLAAEIHRVGEEGLNPWRELFEHEAANEATWEQLGPTVRALLAAEVDRLPKLVAEALWVLRRARELHVEHVHVHFATESALVAWIVSQLGGPGYSMTAHAKDIYRSTVRRELLSKLVGDSQFTVTVCDANVRYLMEAVEPWARERVRRLYNGIDLHDFAMATSPREENLILGVGRLVEKKGFDVLLRALWILKEEGRTFRALILGDGEEREALEAARDALGLQAEVEMPGAVDQAEVRQAMNAATVFALPCRIGEDGNRDALPTVLLEALAVGLPVISTPVTGIPEILDQGRCGRLVDEDDAEGLARALAELLDDAAGRKLLARLGREHAEANFDGISAAETLQGWFESVRSGALA